MYTRVHNHTHDTMLLELPDNVFEHICSFLNGIFLSMLFNANKKIHPLVLNAFKNFEKLKKTALLVWSPMGDNSKIPYSVASLLDDVGRTNQYIQEGGLQYNPRTGHVQLLGDNNELLYLNIIMHLQAVSSNVLVYPYTTYVINENIYKIDFNPPKLYMIPFNAKLQQNQISEEQIYIKDLRAFCVYEEGVKRYFPESNGWDETRPFPSYLSPKKFNAYVLPLLVQDETYFLYFDKTTHSFVDIVHYDDTTDSLTRIYITGRTTLPSRNCMDFVGTIENTNHIVFLPSSKTYKPTAMILTLSTVLDQTCGVWNTVPLPSILDSEYFTYIIRRKEIELYYINKQDPERKTCFTLNILDLEND